MQKRASGGFRPGSKYNQGATISPGDLLLGTIHHSFLPQTCASQLSGCAWKPTPVFSRPALKMGFTASDAREAQRGLEECHKSPACARAPVSAAHIISEGLRACPTRAGLRDVPPVTEAGPPRHRLRPEVLEDVVRRPARAGPVGRGTAEQAGAAQVEFAGPRQRESTTGTSRPADTAAPASSSNSARAGSSFGSQPEKATPDKGASIPSNCHGVSGSAGSPLSPGEPLRDANNARSLEPLRAIAGVSQWLQHASQ
eukprot:CAMPEP_0179032638 /NCGR_PEP_ID=MMETSP0796-20121207/11689_1 /TAXON_ID=73915 /ORGANISM="Pyrodinium bahamense, Strain pbaha01" /LENGTH=255 /DNA_ID=CAMNT_0020728867 /DNA_START=172 /DNA_END=941 /DNA_ORIENTATION=+